MNEKSPLIISSKHVIAFILLIEFTIVPLVPFAVKLILISIFLIILLAFSTKLSRIFINSIKPLLYILVISTLLGMEAFFIDTYGFLRDGYYFFQPILLIFLGYSALSRGLSFIFLLRMLVLSSLFLTFFFYIEFILNLFYGGGLSLESRYTYGLNSDFAIIGLLVTYASYCSKLRIFSPVTAWVVIVAFLFLISVSFSRTNILISLLIILYPFISKIANIKTQLYLAFGIIAVPVFFGAFLNVAIPEEGATNFISKVLNSYSEVIVRDYREADSISPDANLINLYWRSQEAFLGLEKYLEGSKLELIFGQGLGSYASAAGIFEDKLQVIPFFHNGFITILLKAGPVGIFLFFQFLYLFNKNALSSRSVKESEGDFLKIAAPSIVLATLLKTFFIMGFYTAESPVLLLTLIGMIIKKSSK